MKKESCTTSIKQNYESLTPTERKIADYIMEHSEDVVLMPIDKLAGIIGCAKSAVIRLSKALGFEGYSELKISLSVDISKNKQLNFVPYVNEGEGAERMLDKIFSANIKSLHDTSENLDRSALAEVVARIDSAEKIYIYGVGTSSYIAQDFAARLMQIGYEAYAFFDVSQMKTSTNNISERDVAIGISHTGRTTPTVMSIELASKKGAYCACITSYGNTPITELSNASLAITSDEVRLPMEAMSARIVHLAVIDTITASLSAKNYKRTLEFSRNSHMLINYDRY